MTLGVGVFVEPDLNQNNYTVATSALPAWLSYTTGTRTFTITTPPNTYTPRIVPITLTASDGGNSSITATNSFNI